jgi:hypothetical protein
VEEENRNKKRRGNEGYTLTLEIDIYINIYTVYIININSANMAPNRRQQDD